MKNKYIIIFFCGISLYLVRGDEPKYKNCIVSKMRVDAYNKNSLPKIPKSVMVDNCQNLAPQFVRCLDANGTLTKPMLIFCEEDTFKTESCNAKLDACASNQQNFPPK